MHVCEYFMLQNTPAITKPESWRLDTLFPVGWDSGDMMKLKANRSNEVVTHYFKTISYLIDNHSLSESCFFDCIEKSRKIKFQYSSLQSLQGRTILSFNGLRIFLKVD